MSDVFRGPTRSKERKKTWHEDYAGYSHIALVTVVGLGLAACGGGNIE